MHTLKRALIATTVFTVLSSPLIARAQSTPAQPGPAANPNMGEVVVQAQRRGERLQDVPLSVTAIRADVLQNAGVAQSNDLAMVTPGLTLTDNFYNEPTIRGIGSNTQLPGFQANVATYVDNGYQAETFGAFFDLPDVESVDVLKGPQGTLFGKNATGGAILITTKSPNLTRPVGDFYVSYGNYNSYVAKGFVSIPIVQDRLAVSLSALYDHTDGWQKDIITGCATCAPRTSWLVRGKVRFVPWQGADFTLTGLMSRIEDFNQIPKTLFLGNTAGRLFLPPGSPIATQPWTYAASPTNHTFVGQQGSFELQGSIDAGPGKIGLTTYWTAKPNVANTTVLYINNDPFNALIPGANQNFSQEILYTTKQLGRFHGTAGFFYFNNFVYNKTFFVLGPGVVDTIVLADWDRSYAGFGDVTADITDKFSLTAGLRYTDESRRSNGINGFIGPIGAPIPPMSQWFYGQNGVSPTRSGVLEHTWNSWTARVSALYKVTPHTNVYFTFSQGFSSGLYNNASPGNFNPVNPERVNAYEGGIKSDEFRNLSFSAAAFYYDYTDLQTNFAVFANNTITTLVANAAKAQIYGVELNAQWRATENLDFTAGGTILSAKYTSYPNGQFNTPIPCASPPFPAGSLCGNTAGVKDLSGTTMIHTPPWSGDVTAHYHRDFAPGRLDATAMVYFAGKIYWDYNERVPGNPYALLNGTISFTPTGTNLKLSVWGKNLTNAAVIDSDSSNNGFVGYDAVQYAPPRTFGVSAEYSF